MPAVHIAAKVFEALKHGNQGTIQYPAPGGHLVALTFMHDTSFFTARAGQRGLVHVHHMRGIAQVVGQVQVIGLHRKRIAFNQAVIAAVVFRKMKNLRMIRLQWITHPDPDHAHAFGDGVAVDRGIGGCPLQAGCRGAVAAAVKAHAVIAAHHFITMQLTQRQWCQPVRAGIFECHDLTGQRAIEHHIFLQHPAGTESAINVA